MAKYNCAFRTTYFYITDEKKYEEFKKHIVVRDGAKSIVFWHKYLDDIVSDDIATNGKTKHAFGGDTKLLGYVEDIEHYDAESMLPTPDYELFLKKLSEIIEQGSACVITEVGNNELRYLGAQVSIITHNNYETFKLEEMVKKYLLNKKDIVQHDIDMWF